MTKEKQTDKLQTDKEKPIRNGRRIGITGIPPETPLSEKGFEPHPDMDGAYWHEDVKKAVDNVEKESTIILADDILVIRYSKFKNIFGSFE